MVEWLGSVEEPRPSAVPLCLLCDGRQRLAVAAVVVETCMPEWREPTPITHWSRLTNPNAVVVVVVVVVAVCFVAHARTRLLCRYATYLAQFVHGIEVLKLHQTFAQDCTTRLEAFTNKLLAVLEAGREAIHGPDSSQQQVSGRVSGWVVGRWVGGWVGVMSQCVGMQFFS
jgi:hypothetical protein